ncbi:hypothetical protein LTR10_013755 [Elasticomyces elasticus]|uniref:AMP-dependent synthetase/ligase domain-containing protein n=1 Tax=Exophiala sideris TaxID=1016849 RepID=A0ABR0JIH6_9EURO|nr:hypothetical protein LTR10_013755 [Elasticomyces elasticus]KAK5033269.1 hypothetical protein LTS07_003570 [Exophiala sideris]KAK5042234.1 hypothetical protein LTR13_002040 [Exophiala sideris]KAK5063813.1 hypothetical protein LTR69_003578 [Exophiala sideris]KAK5185502.1 hypothetical protein LTR44_002491 [Eurotiomycetes sp. CCFEE 6388]
MASTPHQPSQVSDNPSQQNNIPRDANTPKPSHFPEPCISNDTLNLSDDPHYPPSQTEASEVTQFSPTSSRAILPKFDGACDHHCPATASNMVLEKLPTPATPFPEKKYDRVLRNLRWTVLSVYRRLNIMILTANIVAMIILGSQHRLLTMSPAAAGSAVAVNVTASVLIRQELVINALFWLFGGVHSGAAMSATIWLVLFTITVIRVFHWKLLQAHNYAIPAVTAVLDGLFIAIVLMAHPSIRARLHNTFELVHRFAGWAALALFWVLFGLLTDATARSPVAIVTLQDAIVGSPIFWSLLITTISIALPWLWLRKVTVDAEPLSDHAIQLHFTYTSCPAGAAARLSESPLREWHAFAGIPDEDGQGFSVIVSAAGDWTSKLIRSPPTKLWVRGIPTMGVLYIAPIFKKMVLVATGSGVGPVLSLLCMKNVPCRIIWSTPDPETTYKPGTVEQIRRADPEAIIINTTVAGRPDLVRLTYDLYVSSGAEACFIISNARVTRRVVYALESRGVPIFAPIFDS